MSAPPTQPTKAAMATGSVDIAAPAAAVYALVSDVVAMADLAAENTGATWTKGEPGRVGSVFKGTNRNGVRRWSTTCTVEEATEPTGFAFGVASLGSRVARWGYAIEATGPDSCRVTESMWDYRPGWFKHLGTLATGVSDRATANTEHIATTLAALRTRCES